MSSELTIDYTLSYKISLDIEKARGELNHLWVEAEDDEDQFLEFLEDVVMASLEDWEDCRLRGIPLPNYVTHFSLNERFDTA